MPSLTEALEPYYPTYNMHDLIDQLSALTPTETLKLVGQLEEKWGVSAQTQQVAAAPVPTIVVAEEQTSFTVRLTSFNDQKMAVIKAVRALLPGVGLAEAKAIVEKAPIDLHTDLDKKTAESFVAALQAVGGTAIIQ